jgi:type IV secretory pathway TrbL component
MGRIGQNLMGSVTQPGIARQAGGALARGATAAGRFAVQNPSVIGAALQAVPALSQQNAMAEQTRQMNQLSMEEMKRRQAQRDQMMELLRPLFLQLQQGG